MKKVTGLGIAGIGSLALGLLWNMSFPINKLLWTSSFALFAGGWSMLLLALLYWLIDVRGYRKWAFPFVVVGLNSITIYFAQVVFDFGLNAMNSRAIWGNTNLCFSWCAPWWLNGDSFNVV